MSLVAEAERRVGSKISITTGWFQEPFPLLACPGG